MAKWAWMMLTVEGGLWLDILKHKYLQRAPLATASTNQGSQFSKAITKIRRLLRIGAIHSVGNGKSTVFWLEVWLDDQPLVNKFPTMLQLQAPQMIWWVKIGETTNGNLFSGGLLIPGKVRNDKAWLIVSGISHCPITKIPSVGSWKIESVYY